MRRITLGFFGFLGILLGAALIVPFFLNLNDYKPQILNEVQKALGRDVAIDGDLALSILPTPQIAIHQIRVANIKGAKSQDFMSIDRLRLSAKLIPLFRKQVKIQSLELDQPKIYLEKLENGQENWTFSSLSKASSSSLSASLPTDSSASPSDFEVNFENIKVKDGLVVYISKDQEIRVQEMNLTAQMSSLKGPYAVEGSLKALNQDLHLEGKLGVPTDPQFLHLKLESGGVTSFLEGKLDISSFKFKGTLKALTDSKFLNTYLNQTPTFLSGPLELQSDVVADREEISLTQIHGKVGIARPTGTLRILMKKDLLIEGNFQNLPGHAQCAFTSTPSSQGLLGNINVVVLHSKQLLKWLDVDSKTLPSNLPEEVAFSTQYAFGENIQLKNFHLKVKDARLQGDISWQKSKSQPFVIVDLETPHIENILKVFGVKEPKSFGIAKLKGKLQKDSTSLTITNLKGQLGAGMGFSGHVVMDHKNPKPYVKAALSINPLHLDTLLALQERQLSSFEKGGIHLVSTKGKVVHSTTSKWPQSPFDLSFLQSFDGQFDVTSSQIHHKDMVITSPKLMAKVQNGRLEISSLTATIYGGSFQASGYLTADYQLYCQMLLRDAHLKHLFAQGENIKITAGRLSFSSDLTTHGKSLYEMIHHLAGPVAITAKEGVVSGFDLQNISKRLGNLQNLQSLLDLFKTSMSKGQTMFSSFKGDIAFHEGVGKIQSMTLVAQGGEGQASGNIDLPRYLLDIHSEFRLIDHPKFPPFHLHLTGPLDNPSRKLDISAAQKYMIENVFKGVIDKISKGKLNPEGMLGSLLGKRQPSHAQGQEPNSPNKPEQVVKDIFKGIFGSK